MIGKVSEQVVLCQNVSWLFKNHTGLENIKWSMIVTSLCKFLFTTNSFLFLSLRQFFQTIPILARSSHITVSELNIHTYTNNPDILLSFCFLNGELININLSIYQFLKKLLSLYMCVHFVCVCTNSLEIIFSWEIPWKKTCEYSA